MNNNLNLCFGHKEFGVRSYPTKNKHFLSCLQSIASHRNHFVRRLSVRTCVCLSGSPISWIKNPSKVIFFHTLNIRSRHAFLIAIHVRLLPKFSTTKQVCSKSTSKVFLRIPYLVPALALSFVMLHVAILWQGISILYVMTNYEIFYARDRNIGNLSHFHGTRTSILSWMHAKRTPDGGRRKKMSNSTLFLSGLSRSVMCLNAESDDLNILSTPDTSPFLVTLMLSQSFPVSMRTLS